jgi:hypothetical protein
VQASPIDGIHSSGPLGRLPVGIKIARANHNARRPVRDFLAGEQGQWMKNNMLCQGSRRCGETVLERLHPGIIEQAARNECKKATEG